MSANVAILGAGNVGRALARRLLGAGASVRFGVRDPSESRRHLAGDLTEALVTGAAHAAAEADVVMLAVPAIAALEAVGTAGDLRGKIVVDATNPITWAGGPVWSPPREGSQALALAAAFPETHVIKGFNHFGAEIIARPSFPSGAADAFFAGDHARTKARLLELASQMGFRAHDAGPLRNAALLENLAVLWIQLAASGNAHRNFAFRVESRG